MKVLLEDATSLDVKELDNDEDIYFLKEKDKYYMCCDKKVKDCIKSFSNFLESHIEYDKHGYLIQDGNITNSKIVEL